MLHLYIRNRVAPENAHQARPLFEYNHGHPNAVAGQAWFLGANCDKKYRRHGTLTFGKRLVHFRSPHSNLKYFMTQECQDAAQHLTVAIVEDDALLRQEIEIHLRAHGMVVHATNSAAGLDDLTAREAIDFFLIDLNLPGESGLSLCKRLRESLPHAGIVICTGRTALIDRIAGYKQGGADFYLTKPVSPDELVLVIESLGRRLKKSATDDSWSLSLRDRTMQGPLPEQKLQITSREKTLLVALMQAKDNTLDSGVLCDLFGNDGSDHAISKHSLEELVARLRKKFKAVQAEGSELAIKSVWGVGYQLCIRVNFVH